MAAATPNLLVIEDEPKVAKSLKQGFSEAGYIVSIANSGEEGLSIFLEQELDIVILDLNLPGRDGIDILKTLRQHTNTLPVIILSARDDINDRVLGLDSGANDYLIKPFAFPELLARTRVLLRQDVSVPTLEYHVADLSVDVINRKAFRHNKELNLTPKEFEILELLLRNQGQPVSRRMLATDIWRVERATSLDNVIDVHIMRLRRKVDEGFPVKLIQTIRGLGFSIPHDPESNS